MTVAAMFLGLVLVALLVSAAALVYAACTADLTAADVQDAGNYHVLVHAALAADPHADMALPIQLPRLPSKPRAVIAYRVPNIGARLSAYSRTYIHAQ